MIIRWTTHAKETLDNLYSFYEERSPQAAAKIVADIQKATNRLTLSPQMAAIEPLLSRFPERFRSLVVRRIFKVVYFVDETSNEIIIVTVWDCRQDPNRMKDNIGKRV